MATEVEIKLNVTGITTIDISANPGEQVIKQVEAQDEVQEAQVTPQVFRGREIRRERNYLL